MLLAGDLSARSTDQTNRKVASATFLQHTDENRKAHFVMGADGSGWDKLIHPFGGMRLPYDKDTIDLSVEDGNGNRWTSKEGIMKGEDVFNFTMEIAPTLLKDVMSAANWDIGDVDLFAIHQANKQIVENIVQKADIPVEKTPVEVFSKYANNSTSSVVTVLCDQSENKSLKNVVLCTFGIGLSWGGAAVDLSGVYNGGISIYVSPDNKPSRLEQINHWIKHFRGEN